MLLFGMINWMFTWLKPGRELDHDAIGAMVAELFFGGVRAVTFPDALAAVQRHATIPGTPPQLDVS
jgi:hypothetical protein